MNFDHQLAIVWYSISEIFEQYFATAMQKQKNNCNILIYCKWVSPLLDIRYNLKKADCFPLSILMYNKNTILETIDIIRELVEWFKLINKVVKDKIIFIKKEI